MFSGGSSSTETSRTIAPERASASGGTAGVSLSSAAGGGVRASSSRLTPGTNRSSAESVSSESPLARIPPRDVRHLLQRHPNAAYPGSCAYRIGDFPAILRYGLITSLRADGLTARYIGELGGDRAVRCDPPLPTAPYAALRAVSDDEYAVLRECDVSYFEVTIGEPPARDDDFVPQPECVAVGLASAKARAQICKSLCAPLAR